jgi:signal transduction histidine kinase
VKTNYFSDRYLLRLKHEIRNPLYITQILIETHLEELKERTKNSSEGSSEKTERVLKESRRQIHRVLSCLNRLNRIAQPRSERRKKEMQGVSVHDALERVIQGIKREGYLEQIQLVKFVPHDLPAVDISVKDLEEIFYNLTTNAVQSMLQGGEFKVHASFLSVPKPSVLIAFQDSGCGISREAMPYIFEPFSSDRWDEGGSGFGLYIVKQLVEQYEGSIRLTSREKRGTTLTVIFPVSTSWARKNPTFTRPQLHEMKPDLIKILT